VGIENEGENRWEITEGIPISTCHAAINTHNESLSCISISCLVGHIKTSQCLLARHSYQNHPRKWDHYPPPGVLVFVGKPFNKTPQNPLMTSIATTSLVFDHDPPLKWNITPMQTQRPRQGNKLKERGTFLLH